MLQIDRFAEIRLVFQLAFIIFTGILSLSLFLKARKIELHSHRRISQGYALFGVCFSLSRMFALLHYYTQLVIPSLTPGHEDWAYSYFLDGIWTSSAHAVTLVSIIFIFRVLEHYILQRKPIYTVMGFITLCFHLLALIIIFINLSTFLENPAKFVSAPIDWIYYYPLYGFQITLQNYEGYVQNIAIGILGLVILILYLIIAKRSTGNVRRKALSAFFGLVFLILGLLFDSTIFLTVEFMSLLSSLISIIAVLLVFLSIE